jgi:hypothetical protein
VTVIGVTGHQDIPPQGTAHVTSGIYDVVQSHRGRLVGVCSLAGGADQIFARVVLDLGGALHVIVPCDRYDETFRGADLAAFQDLLAQARDVETLQHLAPTEEAFYEAGRRVVDLCDVLIAVWDGEPARGLGGTADVVDYARTAGRETVVIWPSGVKRLRAVKPRSQPS